MRVEFTKFDMVNVKEVLEALDGSTICCLFKEGGHKFVPTEYQSIEGFVLEEGEKKVGIHEVKLADGIFKIYEAVENSRSRVEEV